MSDTPDVSISMSTHVGDDATETDDLSLAEYGAHSRLRRALWRRGGVLDGEMSRLRRLVGAETDADLAALESVVTRLWLRNNDGTIVHEPTLAEIDRARAKKASYIARGKEGGRGHKKADGKLGESSALADGKAGTKTPPPPPPPSPDPTPTPEPTPEEDTCPAGGPAGPGGVGEGVPLLQLVPTEPAGPEARKPTRPDSVNAVHAVFKHYRERHNHWRRYRRPKDGKAWRLIQARLVEGFSVEELCKAIDGYHKSPYHTGQNDQGKVYLDLELIMRDETKVTHGIEWAENPPKPSNGATSGRDIRVGHVRAEDCDHSGPTGEIQL